MKAERDLDDDREQREPGPLHAAGHLGEERDDQQEQAEQRHDHQADDAVQHVTDVPAVAVFQVGLVDDLSSVDVVQHDEPAERDECRLQDDSQRNELGGDAVMPTS